MLSPDSRPAHLLLKWSGIAPAIEMDQSVWTVWLCSWWAQTAHFLGVGMPLRCARALSLHAVARAWRPLRPRVAGGCRCPGAAPLVGEGAPTREAPFGCEGVILVSISAGGTRARCRDAACSTYEQQAAQRADPNQVLFLRVPRICPHCLSTVAGLSFTFSASGNMDCAAHSSFSE